MNFSPFDTLRFAASADFLLSLHNSRYQANPPVAALLILTIIFCTIATRMFVQDVNPVVASVVVAVAVFWTSFVFSAFVLLFFGLDAPTRYIEKAVGLFLCSFLLSIMALSANIFGGYQVINWIGQDLPVPLAALFYALPYPLFALYLSYRNLQHRVGRLRSKYPADGQLDRINRRYFSLGRGAVAAFVFVTGLTEAALWLFIIEPNNALNEISTAIAGLIPSWA